MTVQLIEGDCLAELPKLAAAGVEVDAIVTDPPYGLEFMGKEWDSFRGSNSGIKISKFEKLGKNGTPQFGPNRRNQKCPERKCLCGGAGAEGRRIYAAGFQEFCESWLVHAYAVLKPGGYLLAFGGTRTHHRIWCAIEDAGFVLQDTIMWLYGSGWPKGRSQLKPAHEPICVAYKPGGKRELQIDECRVSVSANDGVPVFRYSGGASKNCYGDGLSRSNRTGEMKKSRWPANLAHDGSPEVMQAFAAFGELKSNSTGRSTTLRGIGHGGTAGQTPIERRPTDTGTAARFFYSSKAGTEDRWGSKHPTVKPVELMKWLVQLVTPIGGTVLDPFVGSGTTGVAAMATGRNAILVEQNTEYCQDIRERLAHYEGEGRHSLVSKARNRNVEPLGGLFATDAAAE